MFDVGLTTTVGGLYLDGNSDDDDGIDASSAIVLQNGVTLYAKTVLTLEASHDHIKPAGDITLKAGSGQKMKREKNEKSDLLQQLLRNDTKQDSAHE